MSAYYNEIDPYAAEWLRNLIAAGHIAPGDVDERSIEDVRPDDLREYTQCHFFAGVGIWSLGLRNAGWCDTRPVWTGSCPCQPFSAAGKGKGVADERHLFPAWYHLIGECRPPVVFGEQVASKDGLAWLDIVQADLEDAGYACGAVDSCSAGFGAPHIRQRQFFAAYDTRLALQGMADATSTGLSVGTGETSVSGRVERSERLRDFGGLEHSIGAGLEGHGRHGDGSCEPGRIDAHAHGSVAEAGVSGGVADTDGHGCQQGAEIRPVRTQSDAEHGNGSRGMADTDNAGSQGRGERRNGADQCAVGSDGVAVGMADANISGSIQQPGNDAEAAGSPEKTGQIKCSAVPRGNSPTNRPGPVNGEWRDADWLFGRDGKWRPVEPGSQQMVDGYSACLGFLRSNPKEEKRLLNATDSCKLTAQTLRKMRSSDAPQEVWWSLGRCIGLPEATLLLAVMRKQSRELGYLLDSETPRCPSGKDGQVREMRHDTPAPACTPQRREHTQQLEWELGNLVSELSQACPHTQQFINTLRQFTGFPLAHGVPDRVGRLRAYGNAINPVQATEFIMAADAGIALGHIRLSGEGVFG